MEGAGAGAGDGGMRVGAGGGGGGLVRGGRGGCEGAPGGPACRLYLTSAFVGTAQVLKRSFRNTVAPALPGTRCLWQPARQEIIICRKCLVCFETYPPDSPQHRERDLAQGRVDVTNGLGAHQGRTGSEQKR